MCERRKKVFAILRLDVPQLLQPSTEGEIFSCKYNARRAFVLWNSLHCPSLSAMLALGCNSDRTCSSSAPFWRTVCPEWMLILLFINHFSSHLLAKFHSDPYQFDVLLLLLCLPPIILLSYFNWVSKSSPKHWCNNRMWFSHTRLFHVLFI